MLGEGVAVAGTAVAPNVYVGSGTMVMVGGGVGKETAVALVATVGSPCWQPANRSSIKENIRIRIVSF